MSVSITKANHERHIIEAEGYFVSNVHYLDNDKGSVQVEFCSECGYVVSCICEHEMNTWNEEGTKLTCNLCGADGT